MLTIRLQRTGAKNKADFRIVLAESYRSASKKVLEVLGHYNPRSKNFGIKDQDRLNYWIAQHVQLSPTVHNLFVEKKLLTTKKVKAWAPKKSGEAGSQPKADQPSVGGKPSAGKDGADQPAAAAETPAPEPAPVEPQD